ncbi:hypothetical protein [Bizionia saleffrena]|uniref:hypothetical protein n=1 Tax=Bizionia saleffrena TaxID=291189 RepID=UPI001FE85572|nr:hypothetical protein [Bizionia saleffrena]
MNIFKKNIAPLIILFIFFGLGKSQAQSYTEDSLQIKAYTEIKFIESVAEHITLKKVFCDYCSEFQTQKIGEEALRRADLEKYDSQNRLKNGYKKLAVYIRISKDDFASIVPETETDK